MLIYCISSKWNPGITWHTNSVFSVNASDGQCGIIPSHKKANIKRIIMVYYGYVIIWAYEIAVFLKYFFLFPNTITPRGCGFVIGYTGSNSDDEFFIGDICQVSFYS